MRRRTVLPLPVTRKTLPRLQLVATPTVWRADGGKVLLERKGAALLAWLVLESALPRERAIQWLWPDAEPTRARNSLRQRLHRIHKAAGAALVEGGETMRLVAGVPHDLDRLPERLEQDPTAGAGELLGGFDYDDNEFLASWVASSRQRWQALREQTLADLAALHERERRIERALVFAGQLAADAPLQEHAQRRLMRLHYLRGDRAAALAVFREMEGRLERELGTGPGAESRALAALVERSGPLGDSPAPPPVSLMKPPMLVGRAPEMQALAQAAAERRAGLVVGEPGVGKSRLLGALAESLGGATLVAARPDDRRVPYSVLARLTRAWASRLGAPPPGSVLAAVVPELGLAPLERPDALRLRQAFEQALRAWQSAGLQHAVVDDLQFADDASLELLLAAAEDPAAGPAWLFGVRAAEMPPLLTTWLQGHAGERLERIELGPLDAPQTAALVASLKLAGVEADRWSPALWRHTGGNPLYLLETLRALLAAGPAALAGPADRLPTPQSVGRLIERRLEQLSAPALRLARAAAIAGQAFDAALAAQVLGARPLDIADAWRELESAQVLAGQAFAHDLVQEAARRSVPEPVARALHADIAAALEQRGAPPMTVALHWQAAQDWPRAARSFEQAAVAAAAASRRKEEADALASAAEAYGRAREPQRRFDALAARFEASRYVEPFHVARRIAEELASEAAAPAQRLRALGAQARVLNDVYEYAQALEVTQQAIALAGPDPDATELLPLVQLQARALAALERQHEAVAALQRWLPLAEHRQGTPAATRFLIDYGERLSMALRLVEAAATLERAVATAHEQRDWSLLFDALQSLSGAYYNLGRLELAVAALERARGLHERLGTDRPPLTLMAYALARYWRELGRFGESHAQVESLIAEGRASGNDVVYTMAVNERVHLYLWIGQAARARQALAANLDPVPDKARANHRAAVAYVLAAEGKPAAEAFRTMMADIPNDGWLDYYLLRFTVALCLQVPAAEAVTLAREGVEKALRLQMPVQEWPLKVALVEALHRAGRDAEAVPIALEVLERFETAAPLGRLPADYWLHTHEALRAGGRTAAASEALARGVRWVREVGLRHLPPAWHEAFLHRQPVVRALMAAAAREDLA